MVIENVVQMTNWKGYERFIGDLDALGYNPTPIVLDAMNFGVAQQRRRLFILCDRERMPPANIDGNEARRVMAASILDPANTWSSDKLRRPGRAAATLERAERAIAELGKGISFLIVYYGSDGAGGWQSLDRPLRTITTIDRFGLVTWRGGEPYLRMLQVPELMRAMGFKGSYSLDGVGNRRDRVRLLGNGVAPPVMEAIVRNLTGVVRATQSRPVVDLKAA
jgi:DNA (cytosine-5)-methyltransferase 1